MKKIFLFLTAITCICLISTVSNAQSPNWLWAKSAGGVADDQANSIAVDASGNTYVTGWFDSDSITFGTTTLHNAGAYDIFLTKYDASGNVVWAKRAGGASYDYANSVAVDASGNIYVTGYFTSDTAWFGTHILLNSGGTDDSEDMFIAKYTPSGTLLWAKSATGLGDDEAYSVAVDASGNAYVSGGFTSFTLTFGTTMLTNSDVANYTEDIFLVKYDSSGIVKWAKSAGSNGYSDGGYSVAVDATGNVYMTGSFISPIINFGTTILTNADNSGNTSDIFLAKYNSSGTVQWAKSAGSISADYASSLATDASGDAYITGIFEGKNIIFGSNTLINADTSSYSYDLFLAKYDANGNSLWAKSATGLGDDEAISVAVNSLGNVYVAGAFASPEITFGSTTLVNNDTNYYFDLFLAKYDASGNSLWATSAGGSSDDGICSVAIDATGNAYVTGDFNSPTISFGTTTLTNADNTTNTEDMFVAKLSALAGINEYNALENISVFPSPASNYINVIAPKNSVIEILNIEGQTVLQQKSQLEKTNINISNLAKGIYILKLTNNEKIEVVRFVKE